MHSTEVFKGGNGVHYDLGKTIRVPIGSPWLVNADNSGRVGRVDFYCNERTALFMKAVSDAHALVCSAVEEGEYRNPLMRSLEELVEALRLDWEACYITEIAERAIPEVLALLEEEEATPFVVKKGERYLNFDDEGRFATIRTIKEVTEDNEYCLVRICSARVLHLPESEQEAWFELQSTKEFRDLRKLV